MLARLRARSGFFPSRIHHPRCNDFRDQLIGRPMRLGGDCHSRSGIHLTRFSYDNEREGSLAAFRKPMRCTRFAERAIHYVAGLRFSRYGTRVGAASADCRKTVHWYNGNGDDSNRRTSAGQNATRCYDESFVRRRDRDEPHRFQRGPPYSFGSPSNGRLGAQLGAAMQEINAISIPAELAALIQKKAQTNCLKTPSRWRARSLRIYRIPSSGMRKATGHCRTKRITLPAQSRSLFESW